MIPYLTIFWTKPQISRLLYRSSLCVANRFNGTFPKSMLLVGFRRLAVAVVSTPGVDYFKLSKKLIVPMFTVFFFHVGLTKTGVAYADSCGQLSEKYAFTTFILLGTPEHLCSYPISHSCSSVIYKIMQIRVKNFS